MKTFLLIACFWTLALAVFAQNAKIDSLQKVIATTKVDTVRGRSLCRLCKQLSLNGLFEYAIETGIKGEKILSGASDKKGSGDCMNNIGRAYFKQGNFEKALKTYYHALNIHKAITDNVGMANAFNGIGIVYRSQYQYEKAIIFVEKAMRLHEKVNNSRGLITCYGNMSAIYMDQGNVPKSLHYLLLSLKLARNSNNEEEIARALSNLGLLNIDQKKYKDGLNYSLQALVISKKINDKTGSAYILGNIGHVYFAQKEFNKALECYRNALLLERESEHQAGIAGSLLNVGSVLLLQKKNSEALACYEEARLIQEKVDHGGMATIFWNIGNIYRQMNNLSRAKKYVREGLKIAQHTGNLGYMITNSKINYEIDSALGDWKSAVEHHKLYMQYSDSLHNEEKAKEFGRIESKYQFEKEAEEAKRKNAKTLLKDQALKERVTNLQYLSICGILLLLFSSLMLIDRLRISLRMMHAILFAALLILFEFLLILFDPILDQYTGGIPVQKLVFNSVIAFGFAPLHGFLEKKLKRRFAGREV